MKFSYLCWNIVVILLGATKSLSKYLKLSEFTELAYSLLSNGYVQNKNIFIINWHIANKQQRVTIVFR